MARTIKDAVWVTRGALRTITQKSLLIENDQELLNQLQRLFPTTLAGFCVWTGSHDPDVWVKWHWYYDSQTSQFIIPVDGIDSNLVLLDDIESNIGLPLRTLARFVLRRIRRNSSWQPWHQIRAMKRAERLQLRQHQIEADAPAQHALTQHHTPPLLAGGPPGPVALTPPISLSPEELDILRLLDAGKQRKEVASTLNISIPTLDRRLNNIKRLLGVENTHQLASAAKWRNLL